MNGPIDSLARARAGELAAFTAIVREQQRTVYSLALRMLSDRQEAEDLAQDVFLRLHHHLSMIESDAHLGAWLRKVTINRAIDRLRQQPKVAAVPFDETVTVEGEARTNDPLLERRMRALLEELAPIARAIVLLRYQEDLDPTDIARTLDMSISTVKSHLKRSLKRLRERALELAIA